MVKRATSISLSAQDAQTLRAWIKSAANQQLRAARAMIVLMAAEQRSTREIAQALGIRAARVSKWRTRFASRGIAGLQTAERPGKPRTYDDTTNARILALVEQPPPEPHHAWTGSLIARTLGDVSADHVWRVLRSYGISLRERDHRDYEIQSSVVIRPIGMLGLYLSPESSAFLIAAGDASAVVRPAHLRTYVRLPNPEARTQLKVHCPKQQPLTLLAALQWANALLASGTYAGRDARSLEEFLSDARTHFRLREVHAFIVGDQPRPLSGLHLHAVPTFDAWKFQLGSWISVLLPNQHGERELVPRLLAAAQEFVMSRRFGRTAAFEWHAWSTPSAHPKPSSGKWPRNSARERKHNSSLA